ncbi:MAG: tyrosine-type recombinase/integrase, partial [Selenomonas sp.]|nr:tyrosine-type recombinase/integrase [Selenomonas sp.]
FRHTHAPRLIEAGANPIDVAARLGHADVSITQNLYAHDTEEMQRETAAIFGRFVDK